MIPSHNVRETFCPFTTRPFNWTAVLTPVYKQQGEILLLTEVANTTTGASKPILFQIPFSSIRIPVLFFIRALDQKLSVPRLSDPGRSR